MQKIGLIKRMEGETEAIRPLEGPEGKRRERTYSGELVACVADEHTSLANGPVPHRHALNELRRSSAPDPRPGH